MRMWIVRATLCEEHDHRCGADGRGCFGCVRCGWSDAADAEHILLARQAGVPALVVFMNKVDQVDDECLFLLGDLRASVLL